MLTILGGIMARILAVDDARVMRDLVKAVLEDAAHQVETADDGTTALRFARTESADYKKEKAKTTGALKNFSNTV